MKKVLILLPGRPVDSGVETSEELVQGTDLWGKVHFFRKLEFVNNYQTIDSLRKVAPGFEFLIRHVLQRSNLLALFRQAYLLRRFAALQQVDLIHQFWGGASSFLFSWLSRRQYVLSLLGSDLLGDYDENGRQTVNGRLLSWCSKLSALSADAVVVMSAQMKTRLPRRIWSRTYIVPEGVSTLLFREIDKNLARKAIHWAEQERVVIFFDNGKAVKNGKLAGEVAGLLEKINPGFRLEVIKNIAHSKLPIYYSAADALLITSLHEGSNNTLKEALACNCPVVSSDTGDATERLGGVRNCAVVKGWEPALFSAALQAIFNEGGRSNGAEHIATVSLQETAAQLLRVYKSVSP
jgi:glycosyltransferase involved in cell wall biosynthesis